MGREVRNTKLLVAIMMLYLFSSLIASGGVEAQESSISGYVSSNRTNNPIVGANISIFITGDNTPFYSTNTDDLGYFEISGLSAGTYDVKVEASGYSSKTASIILDEGEDYRLNMLLDPDTDAKGEALAGDFSIFALCFQTFILIAIVLVISTIMYSKIKRENLLKHAVRKRIFNYIEENPGKHYRAILNNLDLPIGMLSYHINRLEKAQYLKSRQDGMFRRFYIAGKKTDMRFLLSDIQESILNVIKENKGISQIKIAEKLGISKKVVNYHINILDQAGLILVESRGRETACFISNLKPALE